MTNVSENMLRYGPVLYVSKAISVCREPEQLASVLAEELSKLLAFDFLDVLIFKEGSDEIEWHAVGKGSLTLSGMPIEELMAWHVYNSQEPLHIADWEADERFPRLKQLSAANGIEIGSVVRLPLTTAYRRLGTLGIASRPGVTYSQEEIGLLQMIARVVASGIDDGLNLRRAQAAQAELQRHNDRLELLLSITKTITSNLDLHEVLRSTSAHIREVMRGDIAGLSIREKTSGKQRLYALDFPRSRGLVKEGLLYTQYGAGKRAFETLKPVIASAAELNEMSPEVREELALVEGPQSMCVIPLVNRGHGLGSLAIIRTTADPFAPEEVEFLRQIAGPIAIAIENALAYEEISQLKNKLAEEKLYLEEQIRSELGFEQIIGNSPALKHALQMVETVASSDSTVLLLGETGTGKELIARAIHERSRRRDRTFVKLNCAAIPTGLLESELFGHEKGAFTGAISQKVGRMELADQGTLFLDEVGDIPAEIQPKLLRVLQEREFERLGSTHTRKVNVRIVAATNRDLEKMVVEREFRADLFYRLNVFPIRVPPLRQRREDIPLLAAYFVQKIATHMQKKIDLVPASVIKELTAWEWPGNIRELENFIERAVILTRGKTLEAPLSELHKLNIDQPALPATTAQPGTAREEKEIARIVKDTISSLSGKRALNEHARKQRDEIIRVLIECKGRVGGPDGAAARTGISRTTLISRIRRFGIDPYQYA
jgi:formate hydrogenlyase transcriptional activator